MNYEQDHEDFILNDDCCTDNLYCPDCKQKAADCACDEFYEFYKAREMEKRSLNNE